MKKNKKLVWNCWNQMKVYLDKFYTEVEQAKGVFVKETNGKQHIDANSGLWNMPLGHFDERVVKAIEKQYRNLDFSSLMTTTHKPALDLAEKLVELTYGNYSSVFFTNSGSESSDTAFKMVRGYFYNQGKPEKHVILYLKDGYHGSTYGALSACGIDEDRRKFFPLVGGFEEVHSGNPVYNSENLSEADWLQKLKDDFDQQLFEIGTENIAAFIYEPIQGSEGVYRIEQNYFDYIVSKCRENEILLICDEIATGIGRTGQMFVSEINGVFPDIMLLSKGLTGGFFPLGAVLVTEKIFDAFYGEIDEGVEFVHGFTTSGHPVGCAAAIEVLNILEEENYLERVCELSQLFKNQLYDYLAESPLIYDVQIHGLMIGFRLRQFPKNALMIGSWSPSMIFTNLLKTKNVFSHAAGESAVVLMPPFTLTDEECTTICHKIKSVDKTLRKIIKKSN